MMMLFDVIAEPVSGLIGISIFLILPLIILIEALALWSLKWQNFGRSLIDSMLMNLVSALFGYFAVAYFVGSIIGIVAAFMLSVILEAVVLFLMKRHPARRTWTASFVANGVSYILLVIFLAASGSLSFDF